MAVSKHASLWKSGSIAAGLLGLILFPAPPALAEERTREGLTGGVGVGAAAVPSVGVAFAAHVHAGWGLRDDWVTSLDYHHLLFAPNEPTTAGEHLEPYQRETLLTTVRYWPKPWMAGGLSLGAAHARALRTIVPPGTDPSDARTESVFEWSPAGTLSVCVAPLDSQPSHLELTLGATGWKWDGLLRVDAQLVAGLSWY